MQSTALCAALVVASASLSVSSLSLASPESSIPVIVVTPSRIEQPLSDVGSTVYRLDVPELVDRGVLFVEDALREIPALMVTSYGARGSQVQLFVRGSEGNHVLVLIDGIRVSSAATGEYDFSNLSLLGIDSIEVLMGPQSTLYGSEAIAGVVSITTLKGRQGLQGLIQAGVAKRGERSLGGRVSGGRDAFDYAVSVEDFRTDGISAAAERNGNSEADAYDNQSARVKLGYSLSGLRLELSAGHGESGFDFDGSDPATGLPRDETLNHQDVERDELRAQMRYTGASWTHTLTVGESREDYRTASVFFGSLSDYRAKTRRRQANWEADVPLDERNRLLFGIESTEEALETASNWSSFDGDARLNAAFLEWLHSSGPLNLTLGVRANDHEAFGRFNTWRVTASYRLDAAWRLRAASATGFKAPSLQELYDTTFGANPDLDPEESDSSEIGLEYRSSGYRASITLYDQSVDNLIRYTGVWPNARNENVGSATSRGLELSMSKSWSALSLDLSLSRTDAEETVNGVTDTRLRVPLWAAETRLSYRFDKGRLWLQGLYRDERRDYNWTTGSDVTLDAYTLWNLGASVNLRDDLSLIARIDNASNETYEQVLGYGVPDRTASFSLRWTF